MEFSHLQERILKSLLYAVPTFMGLLITVLVPLVVWLIQNAYMAQSTALLVREMAVDMKEQRVIIRDLPPEEWKIRIVRLEESERQNVSAHTAILVSLEQIKAGMGINGKSSP